MTKRPEPIAAAEQRLALLEAITTELAGTLSCAAVADLVVGRLQDRLEAVAGVVYFPAEDGSGLVLAAHRGVPAEVVAAVRELPADSPRPLARAVHDTRPVFIENHDQYVAQFPHILATNIPAEMLQALVALPFVTAGRLQGGMAFSFASPRQFEAADRKLLETVASQCGQALERARLYEAEQRARNEAQAKAAILEHVTDSIVVTDPEGHVLHWNRGAEHIWGYQAAEMLGKPVSVIFPDEFFGPQLGRRLGRLARGQSLESKGRRKDGQEVWVSLKFSVLRDASENPIGIISVAHDVTERRGAERERAELLARQEKRTEQLRGLAAAALVINSTPGIEAILAAVNDKARSIVGAHQAIAVVAPDQDWTTAVVACSLSDKYADRDVPRREAPDALESEVCTTNRPVRLTQEMLESHPRWRQLQAERRPPLRGWLAAPLVTRDGRNMGLLQLSDRSEADFTALDEDILVQLAQMASTAIENARLLDAVHREKTRAEEASRAKDEFLAMLGHELRNPLSPILTAVELARLRGGPGLEKERTIIERQLQHLVRLVDDLLDVSRITRGKIELKRRPVALAEVVAHGIEMASPLLEERRHRLHVSVPRSGLIVDGDEQRLAQVVANLLTNAAKYTDPGGRIEIKATKEAGQAVLAVRDSGMGIVPELLPRIFDLFTQGKRALDRAQGGLGLGLTIVRSMIDLHGGAVQAHSDGPGQGSTFTVRLPLSRAAAAGVRGKLQEPPSEPKATHARRILVVDDNRDAAELMAEALEAAGHDARVAFDGPEALEMAVTFVPDIALLDIGLPVMDGYELARRLRELPGGGHLRLVAVTGYGQSRDRERSRAAGFDEHMVKPVDLDQLESVIGRLRPKGESEAAPA